MMFGRRSGLSLNNEIPSRFSSNISFFGLVAATSLSILHHLWGIGVKVARSVDSREDEGQYLSWCSQFHQTNLFSLRSLENGYRIIRGSCGVRAHHIERYVVQMSEHLKTSFSHFIWETNFASGRLRNGYHFG